jgi:uncharacterized protein
MTIKNILFSTALLGLCFTACINPNKTNAEVQQKDTLTNSKIKNRRNLVSIIEIPATELTRAIKFYQSILTINIKEADMGDVKMGIFPNDEGTVNVVLACGADYKPTSIGNVIYLNGGDNLQPILDKIEPNGGKIIVPKTEISPEMGCFALFIDTEGNKIGLHSTK